MKYEFDPDNEGTNDILLEIVRLLELILAEVAKPKWVGGPK